MAGRKYSNAYELYGFIPQVGIKNRRHSAICMSCNRVLKNTAATRLRRHRIACAARASRESRQFSNLDNKRHLQSNVEGVQHNENVNCSVKTEQNSMEYEESNNCEEAVENLQNYIPSRKSTTKNERTDEKLRAKIQYFKEKSKYFMSEMNNLKTDKTMMILKVRANIRRSRLNTTNTEKRNTVSVLRKSTESSNTSEHDENPLMLPITAKQSQFPAAFESYQPTTITSPLNINEDIEEVNGEDLTNIEEEFDVIQNLMPRSKASMQLQDELSKAEIEYYRCKANYFKKLTENSKIKRTLMLLESRKLQLEIEKMTNDS